MSNYDRFKPTSVAQTKERKQEVNAAVYENDNNDGKIKKMQVKKDGVYKIRMWPAHPVLGALSIEPKVIYFIPGMRKKKDQSGNFVKDKQGNDIFEQYNRPVFDARIHGKSQFDLVNSYIDLAKKQAEAKYPGDTNAQKTYLAPLVGNKFQGGQYNGIQPIKSFIFYGDLIKGEGDAETKEFFEFEVGKAIEKGIQSTAAIENNNDPLGTDGCFTDPLEGLPMKIIVDAVGSKAANDPSLYYKVSLVKESTKQNVNGRMMSVVKEYPLTEEELDWYDKDVTPLTSYREIFSRRDLEAQLKGLEIFDTEFGYEVLDTAEFKDIWNALDKFFPPVEEGQSNEGGSTNNTKQSSEDEFDLMEMPELKSFIKANKLGIVVVPSMTVDTVREIIREALLGEAEEENSTASEEEVQDDNVSTDVENESEENTTSGKTNYKDRIAGLTGKTS